MEKQSVLQGNGSEPCLHSRVSASEMRATGWEAWTDAASSGWICWCFQEEVWFWEGQETVQQSTLHADSFICYHPQKPS